MKSNAKMMCQNLNNVTCENDKNILLQNFVKI